MYLITNGEIEEKKNKLFLPKTSARREKKNLEMLREAEGQCNSSYTKQTHKTNQPTNQAAKTYIKMSSICLACVKRLVLSHDKKSLFTSTICV